MNLYKAISRDSTNKLMITNEGSVRVVLTPSKKLPPYPVQSFFNPELPLEINKFRFSKTFKLNFKFFEPELERSTKLKRPFDHGF